MLTSGGDCQALNATMRGVAKGLYNTFEDVEVYGFFISQLTNFPKNSGIG
jgi:6-phosphofructokinase